MARETRIPDYGLSLKTEYEHEARRIKNVLGKNCLGVHRMGAASVNEYNSNSVVDFMVVVTEISLVDTMFGELKNLGYKNQSAVVSNDNRFFVSNEGKLIYCLYVFPVDNKAEINRFMALRDYFYRNPSVAEEFEALKVRLATQHDTNSSEYHKGREEFLKTMEKKAVTNKDKQDRLSLGMAVGTLIGFAVGAILGIAIEDIVVGMSCGIGFGLILGFAISSIS